jgi:ferredoxin
MLADGGELGSGMASASREFIVKSVVEREAAEEAESNSQASSELLVTFSKSGRSVPWDRDAESLLEFAEAHGVDISFGCRYGDCGTCMTRLIRGAVEYLHPTGALPDTGTCLPCSCKPETDIELDA